MRANLFKINLMSNRSILLRWGLTIGTCTLGKVKNVMDENRKIKIDKLGLSCAKLSPAKSIFIPANC